MKSRIQDKMLFCPECNNDFVFTIGQQYKAYQEEQKIVPPTLCPACQIRQERIKAWLASQSLYEGQVQWFDVRKGFGFIKSGEENKIFVHHSNIIGKKRLRRGQHVQFQRNETEQGAQATDVLIVQKKSAEGDSV